MGDIRTRQRAAGVVVALGLALLPGAGAATAADGTMTVVDVVVTPSADGLEDGFATLTVDVTLESTVPLDDVLAWEMDDRFAVMAEPVTSSRSWVRDGEVVPDVVLWESVTRVSGTPQDGVWRGTTMVSDIHSGSWVVTRVRDYGTSAFFDLVDVSGLGAGVDLGPDGGPPWTVLPAPAAAVKVVTGAETWVPRARVTDRATGAGVAAAWLDYPFYAEPVISPAVRLPVGAVLPRADAQGYLGLTGRPVTSTDGEDSRSAIHVYGGRGSRGYSWEAATVLWPHVKWQANERFAVSGGTVTASGNAWPAPAVYPAVNPAIHLQQLVGRTWRTVATARVRDSGRYTIVWPAPTPGVQWVRVYKPGGVSTAGPYRTSAGTVLAAVSVVTG